MGKEVKRPLSRTHPRLAKEADGWNPKEVSAGSNQILSWKCSKDHSWRTSPNKRAGRGDGCPYCSGKKVMPGFNDLKTTHPQIAKEAFKWDPSQFSAGSNRRLEWKCKKGHTWITAIAHRTGKNPTNCPYCSGYKVLSGLNDLATLSPKIAKDAFGWNPKLVSNGSNKKYKWKCESNHTWYASVASRTKLRTGCPVCANLKIIPGINDLQTLYPKIASEAFNWDPSKVSPGSDKKKEWICAKKHLFSASINKRTLRNQGCPICANKQVLSGVNDLATTHPLIAAEADGWDPSKVNAGRGSKASDQKRKWRCKLGHTWLATPASRTNSHHKSGCPYCSGSKNLKGYNDLRTTHPEIASEAYEWDPSESIGNHHKLQQWKCPKEHIYRSKVTTRKRGYGCPYCSSRKLLTGFNDLKTKNPSLSLEALGWDPSKVMSNSNKVLKWKCPDGHIWSASVNNRFQGRGCPTCSESGFDPNSKGFLYFLEHPSWEMFQIGITNSPVDRIKSHSKLGWELIEIRGPMDGHLTQQWETAILRMLKAKGADLANSKIAGKFDGYSEAWSKSCFNVKSIRDLMDLTERYEDTVKTPSRE